MGRELMKVISQYKSSFKQTHERSYVKAEKRNIFNKYFDKLLFSISSPLVAFLIIHIEVVKALDNGIFQSYILQI